MVARTVLLVIAFLPFASLALSEHPVSTPEKNSSYEVRGLVLGLDGKPAAKRTVHLIGLSRGSHKELSEIPNASAHWDFTTDEAGRFTARIGAFKTWEDKEKRPGWGNYALVVEPGPDDAGAVSSHLAHSHAEPNGARYGGAFDTTIKEGWEWGPFVNLPPEGLDITLHIQKGITLEGRVFDYEHPEKPLANVEIYSYNNLYTDTHTGYGGEIFPHSAITDAEGRFAIAHIYPVRFYVGIGALDIMCYADSKNAYWLKTRIEGEWKEEVLDELIPEENQKTLTLEILATKKRLFRYWGRVTETRGRPLSGARVIFGISSHANPKTFEDGHHHESTSTNAEGNYEIYLPSPWVRGMSCEARGFQRMDRWADDNAADFPPNLYNFILPSESLKKNGP